MSMIDVVNIEERDDESKEESKEWKGKTRIRMFDGKPSHFIARDSDDDSSETSEAKDEEEEEEVLEPVDPGFTWNYMWYISYRMLAIVDFVGGKLAYALGITSPKYQYVMTEVENVRRMEEEEGIDLREREGRAAELLEQGQPIPLNNIGEPPVV